MRGRGKIIGLGAGLLGLGAWAAFGGEEFNVDRSKREARIYAERSDQYRARPARALSDEEGRAKKIMEQARGILGEADTEAEWAWAAELYSQAAAIAPRFDESWAGLGNAYLIQGLNLPLAEAGNQAGKLSLYGQARSACAKAAELNPESPAANVCLANLLLAEGEVKGILASAWALPEVFKLSDKVAAVDPYYDDGAIFRSFALALSVVPAWIARRFGFAPEIILPYLDQAVERAPNRFINYLERSKVYLKIEKPNLALDDLRFVLEHDPNLVPSFLQENRQQQTLARTKWKEITGNEFPQGKE